MQIIDYRGLDGVHMYHYDVKDGTPHKTMQGKDIEKFYAEITSELFAVYGELNYFSWQQFAFSCRDDGYFHPFDAHTHSSLIGVNGLHEGELVDEDDPSTARDEALAEAVSALLERYNNTKLYMMFGTDAEVIVTRNSIVIIDCSDHH